MPNDAAEPDVCELSGEPLVVHGDHVSDADDSDYDGDAELTSADGVVGLNSDTDGSSWDVRTFNEGGLNWNACCKKRSHDSTPEKPSRATCAWIK